MYTNNSATGETIRTLREARKISRAELAERIGISESHMNKIEAGSRKPSISTYEKIMEILEAEVVIKNQGVTDKDKCLERVRKIFHKSSEKQTIFLTKMLEHMAEHMETIS